MHKKSKTRKCFGFKHRDFKQEQSALVRVHLVAQYLAQVHQDLLAINLEEAGPEKADKRVCEELAPLLGIIVDEHSTVVAEYFIDVNSQKFSYFRN